MSLILIADEARAPAAELRVRLVAAGHQVIAVHACAPVPELVRTTNPDLVLLDQFVPDMAGLDVLAALKRDPGTAHVPVAMMATQPQPAAKIRALWRGACCFLPKPVATAEILALVDQFGGRRAPEVREAG